MYIPGVYRERARERERGREEVWMLCNTNLQLKYTSLPTIIRDLDKSESLDVVKMKKKKPEKNKPAQETICQTWHAHFRRLLGLS